MQLRHFWSDGLSRIAVVWIIGAIALGLLASRTVTLFTLFIMIPFWACYAAGGIVLLIAAGCRLAVPRFRSAALVTLGFLLAFAAAMSLGWRELAWIGDYMEFRIRFEWLEPKYASHLPNILHTAQKTSAYQNDVGVTFVVDSGPPLRVAFDQGGFLDNWEGIVYDPTGVVAQAKGWRFVHGEQEFSAPPAIRRLFGGDIVECDRVRGPWYRCWFT